MSEAAYNALGHPANPSRQYNSAAFEAGVVIKDGPGVLLQLYGYNKNSSVRYIQLFDAVSAPADGAVPMMILPCAGNWAFDSGELRGKRFSTGIYACISTTAATKTIGSTDAQFNAEYR